MTFPTEWKNKSHVPNHQPDHHALLAKAIKGYMTQSAGEETWRLILREVQGLTSTQFLSAQLTYNFENITSGHKRKYAILYIYIILYNMTLVVAVSYLDKVPDDQSLLTILLQKRLEVGLSEQSLSMLKWQTASIRSGFHGRYHQTPSCTTHQLAR